jgi:hypothetical protein
MENTGTQASAFRRRAGTGCVVAFACLFIIVLTYEFGGIAVHQHMVPAPLITLDLGQYQLEAGEVGFQGCPPGYNCIPTGSSISAQRFYTVWLYTGRPQQQGNVTGRTGRQILTVPLGP